MHNDVVLRVEGVSKRFPGVQALSDVSFELRAGEVHALMGENGAGKSTLINVLGGLVTKDAGHIYLSGQEVHHATPYESHTRTISFIHQELEVVENLTVTENIFLGREIKKGPLGLIDWDASHQHAGEFLASIDVDINPRSIVGELSVAQQQLVEIAKALFGKAKIIVMDEPTSSLGGDDVRKLFQIIHDLKRQGVSVIYVSHVMDEIFELSDRITVLRSGKYVGTVETRETNRDQLFEMIVGREVGQRYVRDDAEIGNTLLEVRNLSTDGMVRDVSFEVRSGELVGIAGLIGAGRTELLEAVFGIVPWSEGSVVVDGVELVSHSPKAAIRGGLYYLSEDRRRTGLFPTLNLLRNVGVSTVDRHRRWWGIDEAEENDHVSRLTSQLRVKAPSLDELVAHLSGGNQQKAMLARGLKSEPKIIAFNEPTRGIDVGAKIEIYRLLNDLKQQGLGILVVSSELPEVLSISDRVLVMSNGRLAAEYHHSEAEKEKVLKAMFSFIGQEQTTP